MSDRASVKISEQRCRHCGGLHYGQLFLVCPYMVILADPKSTEEQKENAKSILRAHSEEDAQPEVR